MMRQLPPSLMLLAGILLSAALGAQPFERRTPVVVAVEKVGPSVVNISTERRVSRAGHFEDWYERLFEGWHRDWRRRQVRTSTLGSGVIIDPDGYIITNEHVVRMGATIQVEVHGIEPPFTATLLASDTSADLALLRIFHDEPLPWLPIGSSADLMIGETSIAIGNPFGLASTVSTGVISAIGREVQLDGNVIYDDFLQIDASINPGNSGGPLLDINGEVIGINNAIRADAEGIGFAIPADRVRETIRKLSDPARIRRTYFGFEPREGLGKEKGRLFAATVDPDGPAGQAGLEGGDEIRAVSGKDVANFLQLNKHLLGLQIGEEVTLTIARPGKGEMKIEFHAAPLPLSPAQTYLLKRIGFHGRSMSQGEVTTGSARGYLIQEVQPGSPASELGLRSGDLVIGFSNGRRDLFLHTEATLIDLLRSLEGQVTISIIIERSGRRLSGPIKLR